MIQKTNFMIKVLLKNDGTIKGVKAVNSKREDDFEEVIKFINKK